MRQNSIKDVCIATLFFGCGLLVGCGDAKVTSTPVNRENVGLTWVKGQYASFLDYVDRCETPRSGIDPATGRPFTDRAGSASLEKFALRSYSRQTYLWANDLADQDPTTSLNPQEYFNLLKVEGDYLVSR